MKILLMAAMAIVTASAAEKVEIPIENEQVKVLKVEVQPHEATRLHQHKVNRVMIYLQPGRQAFDYSGQKSTLDWKAGEVKWSPAAGMHTAEIISEAPVTIVEVELKKPGREGKVEDALDPVKVDPKHYGIELENDQVRVIRVKLGPHETTPQHSHSLNRVVVYLSAGKLRTITPEGQVTEAEHKAGDITWAAPAKHKDENAGERPIEIIAVEVKN